MIIVDSSAVIAMIFIEPAAGNLAKRLAKEPPGERLISAMNYVEAGTVLAGRRLDDPLKGVADLDAFLSNFEITCAAIDEPIARLAMQARIRFGKGFRTTGKLNLGDCFAYALAKVHDAPLLYVGDDFRGTDVTSAL